MKYLETLSAALLIAASSTAQILPTPSPPKPGATELVKEPTLAERVAKLDKDLTRLRNELANIRSIEKSGGLAPQVRTFLADRALVAKSVKAPKVNTRPAANPARPAPAPAPARVAPRLLTEQEKAKLGPDVMFTVEGHSVTRKQFKAALDYLKSYPNNWSDEQLQKQAVLELARVTATRGAFDGDGKAAREKVEQAKKKLADGTAFEDVAKELSDCPTSTNGGQLGFLYRSNLGFSLGFTRAAFDLKVGEVSDPVPSTIGYHLIKVTGIEKGAEPASDRVKLSHIQAMYGTDRMEMARISQRIMTGQAEFAFATEADKKLAPGR